MLICYVSRAPSPKRWQARMVFGAVPCLCFSLGHWKVKKYIKKK